MVTIVATFITGESDDPHLLERCRALVERLLNYNDLDAADWKAVHDCVRRLHGLGYRMNTEESRDGVRVTLVKL